MLADKRKIIEAPRRGTRNVGHLPGKDFARQKVSDVYVMYMNLKDYLVDLIGIEPMTSSMP
jgi:hypothetical protein